MTSFVPATREQSKARIALCGPSGSGKTYSALAIASGLGERIALVDTEHGSASKYSGPDLFAFDTTAPSRFDPRDLVRLFAEASHAGYDVVIVDSLTHYWSGPGGVLELVDQAASRSRGNSFAGWKDVRPFEKALIDAFLGYPGHVIVTMRTKTEYVVEDDDRGRKTPRKVGLKPEQRDGIEYELDIVGDLDVHNRMVISKTRCPVLAGAVIDQPGAELAQTVLDWLAAGVPVPDALEYRDEALKPDTTTERLRAMHAEVKSRGLLGAALIDEHGDESTLGALIVRLGQERKPA